MREQAWQLDGWADTVSKVRFGSLFPQSMLSLTDARRAPQTAQMAKFMDSYVMVPLSFSPLK